MSLLLVAGSAVFYAALHECLVRAILRTELTRALRESQRLQTFEVSPRRLALKLCGSVQVILAFGLGLLVVHDLTGDDGADPFALSTVPRARLSPLFNPVRSTASELTERAVLVTAGFWVFEALLDGWRIASAATNGQLRGRGLLAAKTLGSRACPLAAAWAFARWRARALDGDHGSGVGMGFPDLLVGLLLCSLLPGLLSRTRWVVLAVDADAMGSAEVRFLDVAAAVNSLVCRVFMWPFLLLLHHRHERGGLDATDVDEVPPLVAIVDALHMLPLRCVRCSQHHCCAPSLSYVDRVMYWPGAPWARWSSSPRGCTACSVTSAAP